MTVSRQCVILVGGLGTRLGELVKDTPKPLLDVGGRPFVDQLIRNAVRFGFDDIVLLAGYRSERVRTALDGGQLGGGLDVRVRMVVEPEPLGTGGALFNARDVLADTFLMLNGDTYLDVNLLDVAARPVSGSWTGRLALRWVSDTTRFGVVELAEDRVVGFLERPMAPGPGLANGGVYYLRRKVLDHITELPCSIESGIFPRLAAQGKLFGIPHDAYFVDIGVPADLDKARRDFAEWKRPALFFDRDGVLNKDDGYTHRAEDFSWMQGAVRAVRRLNNAGWFVFVVTNQAGIARGIYDEDAVHRLHDWMNLILRQNGAHIDDFAYCPHHVEGVVEGLTVPCDCRKPAPGMLRKLAAAWPVDMSRSVLIGDKESDLAAAASAGVKGVRFRGGDLDDLVASLLDP